MSSYDSLIYNYESGTGSYSNTGSGFSGVGGSGEGEGFLGRADGVFGGVSGLGGLMSEGFSKITSLSRNVFEEGLSSEMQRSVTGSLEYPSAPSSPAPSFFPMGLFDRLSSSSSYEAATSPAPEFRYSDSNSDF